MNTDEAAKRIKENTKPIFAFALSKLGDRCRAEELASDIIFEMLRSSVNIRDDTAFYSFMWSVSNNVFKRYLRNQKKITVEFDDVYTSACLITPEDEYIDREQLYLLRRELSLLSDQYREATVRYYIYNRTCAEISKEMKISIEMVKYYLFKTRKLLKEGMGMANNSLRELGEKSYNPGVFRCDRWTDCYNADYYKLFERKLPGNILLSTYYTAMTIQELSLELGIAVPYLEDELNILTKNDMLKKLPNDKYQTNIIIFTDAYETEIEKYLIPLCENFTEYLFDKIKLILPEARKICFEGCDYNDNRFLWTIVNILMKFAGDITVKKEREMLGDYPLLYDGNRGFYYGYDYEWGAHGHHYNGVYNIPNDDDTTFINICNYVVIEKCQITRFNNWNLASKALFDAMFKNSADESNEYISALISAGFIKSDNVKLSALFPVLTKKAYDEMRELLNRLSVEIADFFIACSKLTADIMNQHSPKSLAKKNAYCIFSHGSGCAAAYIIESAVKRQILTVPDTKEKLCMFGVIK